MWRDETDATQLAQRLRVGPRELTLAIGGPWHVAPRVDEHESEVPGTLYVGRAGPSVGVLVAPGVDPRISVGVVEGQWRGVTALAWVLADPLAELQTPPRDAEDVEIDEFLVDLGAAVEEAFAAARGSLVICRYCGSLVAPAHLMLEQACGACATSIFGVVR